MLQIQPIPCLRFQRTFFLTPMMPIIKKYFRWFFSTLLGWNKRKSHTCPKIHLENTHHPVINHWYHQFQQDIIHSELSWVSCVCRVSIHQIAPFFPVWARIMDTFLIMTPSMHYSKLSCSTHQQYSDGVSNCDIQ